MTYHTYATLVNMPFKKKTVFWLKICICLKHTPQRSCLKIF